MAGQINDFGVALYYPYINIDNIEWLKAALLYWDKIRCINPDKKYFDEEIKILVDEEIVEAADPRDYSKEASQAFLEKLSSRTSRLSELDILYDKHFKNSHPGLRNLSLHHTKFSEKVFEKAGLKVLIGDGDFYNAQPYISLLYLTMLASKMSKSNHTPLLTDIPGLASLGQCFLWSNDILSNEVESENLFMKLNIPFPTYDRLEKVTFADILSFHNKRGDERRRFRKAIEGIRNTAKSLDDPVAFNDYLNEQKKEIGSAFKDHKKALEDIEVKDFVTGLNIVQPLLSKMCKGAFVGGSLGGAAGTAGGGPIGGATGATVGGVIGAIGGVVDFSCSFIKNKISISKEFDKEINDCPWHYLINLEQEV